MSDVFISYPRHVRGDVQRLADHLRVLHVDVWFDVALSPGSSFADEINVRARTCRAMIVCWTGLASRSPWVIGEAEVGRQRGCLVPVMFEQTMLPIPFNTLHTESLEGWTGEADHPGLVAVLRQLGHHLGRHHLGAWSVAIGRRQTESLRSLAAIAPDDPLAGAVEQLIAHGFSPWDASSARGASDVRARHFAATSPPAS